LVRRYSSPRNQQPKLGLIRMELPKLPDICPCGHPRREHDHEFKCAHCRCTALRRLALGQPDDEGKVI
jgi:hypothetical protein